MSESENVGRSGVEVDSSVGESVETDSRPVERRWSKKTSGKTPVPDIEPLKTDDAQKERQRADELLERLQRSMADLSNYRKRVEAEREEMAKLASMLLVAELLPVLDNFERALESIPKDLEMFSWLQGIMLIERHLRAILDRQGVEAIEAVGKEFNPSLHEAIVEDESDAKPGTIVGELQRGYTMHGHVLRPTLAKVAKAPEAAKATADPIDPTSSEPATGEPESREPAGISEASEPVAEETQA